MNTIVRALKRVALFRDLSIPQLKQLAPHVEELSWKRGDIFPAERHDSHQLLLIKTGKVEVLHKEQRGQKKHSLSILHQGDIIAEALWLEPTSHAVSFHALKDTVLLKISIDKLKKDLSTQLFERLAFELALRLHASGGKRSQDLQHREEALKMRSAMGTFILHLTILIFIYIFTLNIINRFSISVVSSSEISFPILTVFGIAVLLMIKQSGYPYNQYGLTVKRWKSSIGESLLFTIPVLGLMLATKWLLIKNTSLFSHLPLFELSSATNSSAEVSSLNVFLLIAGYCIFIPVQELIFRGGLQSSLEKFFMRQHKVKWAILISNLPFSMIHLHLSLSLTLFAYFFGLFWGWMYARQHSLIGVMLSHLLIGVWAFFFLGFQDILRL